MSISPVLMSGVIQRADDIGTLKNQQDIRPVAEQQNAQVQVEKHAYEIQRHVIDADDANKTDTHADAREKGKNTYFSNKKSNKKEKKERKDQVIRKDVVHGIDIKV